MAFNRYVAIELPHRYKQWLTKRALAVTMLVSWLINVSTTLQVYFGAGTDFTWSAKNGVCYSERNGA